MLDVDRADTLLGTLRPRRAWPSGASATAREGERKRALIARALVAQPRLLLLDEPGAGLDLPGPRDPARGRWRASRTSIRSSPIVVTTHHLEELPARRRMRSSSETAASWRPARSRRRSRSELLTPASGSRSRSRGRATAGARPPGRRRDSRYVPGTSHDSGGSCPWPPLPLPPALDPLDFLAIDALLDDEEKAIRDTVRQFVREQMLPEVGDWFEQGILPREVVAELAKLGLFGMHLDGYGLPGASAVAYGLTCLELEAGDSGIRSVVSVQGSLAMFAIWRWGSEEQKERVAAADARRRGDRLLRPDRARRGLGPRHDADARAPRRVGLDPQRGQDVDHERLDRRHRDRLGPHRGRRDPRLHRREGNARVHGSRDPQEAVAARVGDLGARARRRARTGRQHAARRVVAERARSRASTRLASASSSAPSVPRGRASRRRSRTRRRGSCSRSRSPPIS